MEKLHLFMDSIAGIALPDKFTYPFFYIPHPLSVRAAGEVQRFLSARKEWQEELDGGKMFGVLVVRTPQGEIGYLAAFSGMLAGRNQHDFFVPPVYDLQDPQGFFKTEEKNISEINRLITTLKEEKRYADCLREQAELSAAARTALENEKKVLKAAKAKRDLLRKTDIDEAVKEELIRESQFQKAEFKRLKESWNLRLTAVAAERMEYEKEINRLENERKHRSATLQKRLFAQFEMLNRTGEKKNLVAIFEETPQKTPPAGAGECAAPRLLQYAFLNRLEPLAMAEFWWGASPEGEVRRHGCYYPACKGKCEPILRHMLQGIEIEENPLLREAGMAYEPEILFEDEWLLGIYKPAGLLSVPGKSDAGSVYRWVKQTYPQATGPLLVHRLDMATSGILLVAKTKEVHQHLQAQFKNRTIQKRYIALLDGIVQQEEGTIILPLRPDPIHRPQQVVDRERGKPAVTRYRVLERKAGKTHVCFYPLTGRTHQLRVHAAHPSGLNVPIRGDSLYGTKAERLYLHAESITFRHPVGGESITIERKADF